MTSGGSSAQAVGSVTFIDSSIENTPVGILTAYNTDYSSFSNGSLVMENVSFKNVGTAVQGLGNMTSLGGSRKSMTVAAWG
jgi:glucan 1,3-beta-glucosidase